MPKLYDMYRLVAALAFEFGLLGFVSVFRLFFEFGPVVFEGVLIGGGSFEGNFGFFGHIVLDDLVLLGLALEIRVILFYVLGLVAGLSFEFGVLWLIDIGGLWLNFHLDRIMSTLVFWKLLLYSVSLGKGIFLGLF